MGVLPCSCRGRDGNVARLTGEEVFDLIGIDERAQPRQAVTLVSNGKRQGGALASRCGSIRRRNSTTCATAASCLTCSRG